MDERRKNKRLPLRLELNISSLFKQDQLGIANLNENIEVVDISKSGVGFRCKDKLPIDYYFDAKIELTKEKFFYGVLKIVRIEQQEDAYFVGAEFVGLAEILSKTIDAYGQEMDQE
ncbi:PilZ domain-containing protein [Anaerosolibacter carboniphilus]|nr:PilZ domain-containing protein [Anaerosolibacter carboniphilus]